MGCIPRHRLPELRRWYSRRGGTGFGGSAQEACPPASHLRRGREPGHLRARFGDFAGTTDTLRWRAVQCFFRYFQRPCSPRSHTIRISAVHFRSHSRPFCAHRFALGFFLTRTTGYDLSGRSTTGTWAGDAQRVHQAGAETGGGA